ncbi:aminotransferase class III-fold pyridoxal phosphate-dependent enzyme [Brevibacterium casei]|nr:aminotransferase class III-fold pyridoxal phosphate-dependent enzyme [Brevibacterium casei]
MAHSPPSGSSHRLGNLDEKSKAIIVELQHDGRKSYSAIGKSVGLSEAAVRQRVSRLIDSGVMEIVAVTDPLSLGFARQAMVGVKVRGDISKVADRSHGYDEIDYLVVTAGSFDLLVEIVCESDRHLIDFVNRELRSIDAVVDTELFMYLSLEKQKIQLGDTMTDNVTRAGTPYQEAVRNNVWMHMAPHQALFNGGQAPIITRGEGHYIFDDQGKRYIDGLAGLFTVQVGHGREEIAKAMYDQTMKRPSCRCGPSPTRRPSSSPSASPPTPPATSTASSSPPAAATPSSPR